MTGTLAGMNLPLLPRPPRPAWIALCLAGLVGGPLVAAEPDADGSSEAPSCVTVEVNGERVPAFECLTRKLSPAAPRGAPAHLAPGLDAERIAQRPGHQLGQANPATSQHRMGNAWGHGVVPQRPTTAPPASPLIPSR